MNLCKTVLHTPDEAVQWLRARGVRQLCADSRSVGAGDGFFAWPGEWCDGRSFLAQALTQGAAGCLMELDGAPDDLPEASHPAVAGYARLHVDAGEIASAFYGHPSQRLNMVAFTGTNGKTSSAWWLAHALSGHLGEKEQAALAPCGLIGTLGMGMPGNLHSTGMTTPDAVRLQRQLRAWVDAGVHSCAIEASSIGLEERRLEGCAIRVAVFTNFTQDHLDWHGDMDSYWRAKLRLFDWPALQAAVINVDDARGAELAEHCRRRGLDVWTLSRAGAPARLSASAIEHSSAGLRWAVREEGMVQALPFGGSANVLAGEFNVSNLLGVLGALRALGVSLEDALHACAHLPAVPGRLQRVAVEGAPLAVVDYAHTPDALEKVLHALRPLTKARGGRLHVVFGCGGNRDRTKRPLMGAAAVAAADEVMLTSDNPRMEEPGTIIEDVLRGLGAQTRVCVEPDRGRAIAYALSEAAAADIVLIAGKGHEDYQDVRGRRLPFSDAQMARNVLQARAGMNLPLGEVAAMLPGTALTGDGARICQRVSTDSRTLQEGDLFVALKGESFDAADFLPQVAQQGAAAALCSRQAAAQLAASGLPGVLTDDTQQTLGELARGWRQRFKLPLIAVTGSNGKTTVTQMLAAIGRAWLGDAALATRGNLNNSIGAALTLLRLRPAHRLAVVELGMNHPGEMEQLARMAAPTVALVNNAQREHQEFMGSVQAAAEENGAVLAALPADGVAVFPAGDDYQGTWQRLANAGTVLMFGEQSAGAQVFARSARWQGGAWEMEVQLPGGVARFALHAPGRHNALNALAACACASAAGVPQQAIEQGLQDFRPLPGRGRTLALKCGGRAITLIDDSYNANPDSVRALIDVLAELPGARCLALGDMGEVGAQGEAFHREVGAYARERGVQHFLTLGALAQSAADAFGAGAQHCADMPALIAAARGALEGVDVLAAKGSRFMHMERLVQALQQGEGAAC